MREIKFRAWIAEDRYMGKVTSLHMGDGAYVRITGETPYCKLYEIELMQYTGLKDKKGIEIYEGDILAIEGATAKVVFWERPPAFGLDFSHNEDKWCEDWNLSDDSERMEIVGNVYANPELLTK